MLLMYLKWGKNNMPKLDNFFSNNKSEKIEQILTKKMHPQLISLKKLEESKLQYRDIPQEDIERLADLIELDGEVLQPLLVRKAGADTYEILAGHKRYRACKLLSYVRGLEQFSMIPCYVKVMTDAQAEFAVYSTNGYNRKTDYEIMREIEGMSRLLKENPELFPETASGRLVEKLAGVMNMSKTVVQEYKTIANNLGNEAMEKFKKNEITKESAKTLAGLSSDEQKDILSSGKTETKDIKEAARIIRNPSMSEIRSAFKKIYNNTLYTKDVIKKYSSLEEYFKEKNGRTHNGYGGYGLSYECSLRGIKINNRKEITWHEFVNSAIEMGLYNPDDIYKDNWKEKANTVKCTTGYNPHGNCVCCGKNGVRCCLECEEECNGRCGWYRDKTDEAEQIPGQDNIYNHPEYLPNDTDIKESDVSDSIDKQSDGNSVESHTEEYNINQADGMVCNIKETERLVGVKKIGTCPYCNSPLTFISNKKYCGSCGEHISWN